MPIYKLLTANDKSELATISSELIADEINSILKIKSKANVSLAGGSTPKATYKLLSNFDLRWEYVNIFLGDERWVDRDNSASNFKMIKNSLLAQSPGNKASIYPVPFAESSNPEESAQIYSQTINNICRNGNNLIPAFDLCILGLGDDGHTASLFPGSNALNVKDKLVTVSKGKGLDRITFTAPLISASKKIIFLVSGDTKQLALKRLLDPSEPPDRTPAKLVSPKTEILVIVDKSSLSSS